MTTQRTPGSYAFVGKAYLAIGNGASPESFTRYCEVDSISGVGQKNALVDVTTFCSGGNMEYIPGLADGSEVTFGANFVLEGSGSPDFETQQGLIADVENKVTRNVTIEMGDGSSPAEITYHMALAMLSWELAPSVSKQNQIKFVGKITGAITT
jgi:hypothetical protein